MFCIKITRIDKYDIKIYKCTRINLSALHKLILIHIDSYYIKNSFTALYIFSLLYPPALSLYIYSL